MAGQGLNTVLTAAGVGTFALRTTRISFGLNVIATEGQSATFKYLYTRQVQVDTFSIQVLFDSTAERNAFFNWYRNYANLAIVPSPVGSIRVQVPSRNFDMTGTLIDGPTLATKPEDVTWDNTLNFKGATFTNQAQPATGSKYVPPSNTVASKFFYPTSTDLGASIIPTPSAAAQQAGAVQALINLTKGIIGKLDHLLDEVG